MEDFEAEYLAAVTCLVKDRESLLAFYDLPAEHWCAWAYNTGVIESAVPVCG